MKKRLLKKRMRARLLATAKGLGVKPRAVRRATFRQLVMFVGPLDRRSPTWWVLDERGEPRPARSWLEAGMARDDPRRTVGKDHIEPGILVSTVFLGLDHGYGLEPRPILYETMIFGGGVALHESQWRYSTRAEAQAGHQHAVERVRAALASRVGAPS